MIFTIIANKFDFDGKVLTEALKKTFLTIHNMFFLYH